MSASTFVAAQAAWVRMMRRALGVLRRASRHPLTLLLVGAVITGLLVPALTNRAQEHKQELQLKAGLVNSISDAISPFLAATLENELIYRGAAPRSYDLAYGRWDTRSAVIATKLRTYFGRDSDLVHRWNNLVYNVQLLYYVFRWHQAHVSPREDRAGVLEIMKPFIDRHRCRKADLPAACAITNVDLIAKFAVPRAGINGVLDFNLRELLKVFRLEAQDTIDEVLAAKPRT